jgi:TolA-binding protein
MKLGEIYQKKADFPVAIENYQKIIKSYPGTEAAARAMLRIGTCYLQSGQPEIAARTFRQILDQNQGSEIGYRSQLELGKINITNARYDDAIRDLKAVVDFQVPDLSAEAQYWIGEAYFNQKNYSKAAIEYLKIKYLFPGVQLWIVRGVYQAGLANENQLRFGEARLLYRNIIEQYQDREYHQKAQLRLQQIAGK